MDSIEKVLPSKVNLVRLGKPEMSTHKTKTETEQPTKKKDCKLPSAVKNRSDGMELKCSDVLERIIPASEWEMGDKLYRLKLSTEPGSKTDIKNLTEKLDKYLVQYNAKEVGICPIRDQLYFQCFNEIIRQVTVHCAERGSLLIRLRDEMKMNIDCYRQLYESLTARVIQKPLQIREKKSNMEEMVQQLMSGNEKLEAKLAETIAMTQKTERDIVEAREAQAKLQAEELAEVKGKFELIKNQLNLALQRATTL